MNEIPIIIGTIIIIMSVISIIISIMKKEYKTLETNILASGIVSFLLGIMVLINNQNSIPFIAIVWGILGLKKGVKGLNIALYNKANKKKYIIELIHSIIETILSILLIFNPFEKFEEHLIILGIEMIVSSLKIVFKDKKYVEAME